LWGLLIGLSPLTVVPSAAYYALVAWGAIESPVRMVTLSAVYAGGVSLPVLGASVRVPSLPTFPGYALVLRVFWRMLVAFAALAVSIILLPIEVV
jgi:hypothetical protein